MQFLLQNCIKAREIALRNVSLQNKRFSATVSFFTMCLCVTIFVKEGFYILLTDGPRGYFRSGGGYL
jgi:hypothetical protein